MPERHEEVVDFEEALERVREASRSTTLAAPSESVALLASQGRIMAETLLADRDQPAFDRSTRDGFAVRADDFNAGIRLRVLASVRAGTVWEGTLSAGESVAIMTGAPVPAGADAIAMVEHVERDEDLVFAAPGRRLAREENIVRAGREARSGEPVLAAGTRLGAAEIALAAACGKAQLQVRCRPRVAILATGDELMELDQAPGATQIRNSNSYAIAAMVEHAGGTAVRFAIVPDERAALARSLEQARQYDLIVLSGGVSMGEYDLVEEMLLAAGAEFLFTGVRMQPGRPAVLGRFGDPGTCFFGLPGNPVSTEVTFHCFVEPFLHVLSGGPWEGPRWALARLAEDVPARAGLTRLLPARMASAAASVEVRLVGWQGSGDLAANARANCYAELLPGAALSTGDVIRVLLR